MLQSLAITTGSSRGVGPQVVGEALEHLNLSVAVHVYATSPKPKFLKSSITWEQVRHDLEHSASLGALNKAIKGLSQNKHFGLVTGPVTKAEFQSYRSCREKGSSKILWGHTEILADAFSKKTCMLFLNTSYRVALVTQHILHKDVSSYLTLELIVAKCLCFANFLKQHFTMNPRIALLGLNPHAQTDTYGGESEEDRVIKPAIEKLQNKGLAIEGPISADTAFFQYRKSGWDGLVSLYHDQGLSFLKGEQFHQTVNVTAGLPFIRTSVDHGVGVGLKPSEVDYSNMLRAIEWALLLAKPGIQSKKTGER